jgi:4-amino-4-deoxy-L-arabinose transferase-like glycosyltransferase
MLKKLQNNPIITITLIVIIMLGFNIDALSVSIMEARNFITAREILTDGNWLLTTMNGEARYEKPPLPTWLTAISASIFGIKNILALRFPALIFIMITGVFTYLLSNKIVDNTKHSMINALIVITSFYIIGITIEAPWDIFTHGFMLIAIYSLFQVFTTDSKSGKHALIAGFFIGCSILSKGPISFYALLLPFLLAYGFSYKYKLNTAKVASLFGCLILALCVGGWWYLYVRFNDSETFTAIAEKETRNWSSYHVKPFYYYWSFFIQSGIWTIPAFIGLLYPYLKSRVSHAKAYKFSFLWTIFGVILLSIIPEKKPRYLMPVLIPLAINTGFYIEYLIRSFKTLKDKRETIPVYFNFLLIALIAIAFPIGIYIFLGEKLAAHWLSFSLVSIASVGIGLSIIIQLKKKHIQSVFILTVLFFASLLAFGLPLSKAITSSNYKPITNLKEEASEQNIKVYGLNYVSPEMIWQFGGKIPALKTENNAFNFPEDKQFGMLANGISLEDQELLQRYYNMEQKAVFDLNQADPESRKYNNRLINYYYILTKK